MAEALGRGYLSPYGMFKLSSYNQGVLEKDE